MALEIYSLKSRSAEWIVVTFCKVISFNCLQINCFLFNKITIPFWLESMFRIITLKSDSILKEGKKNWLSLKIWLPMHLYQISEPFFAYGTIHRLYPMNKLINFRLLGFKKIWFPPTQKRFFPDVGIRAVTKLIFHYGH